MDDELEQTYRDLELDRTNLSLLDRIIELETERGYPEAAARHLWIAAHQLEQAKDGAGVLAILERLMRVDPDATRNLQSLAVTCVRLNLPSQALALLGRSVTPELVIRLCGLRHDLPALAHALAEPLASTVGEHDAAAFQKLGELFQKMGADVTAAVWFTRVAEEHAGDGFPLKAIALYKQVAKLDPLLSRVKLRLGELHAFVQLHSEAALYFKQAEDEFTRAGDEVGASTARKRLAELPS